MTVFTFSFPPLFSVFCLPGSSVSNVLVSFAVVFPDTWHRQAQRSTALLGWKLQGCTQLELGPFPQKAFFWLLGASGFRIMNIITLRQNMVSCEGGDTVVVTLDCESPF